MFKDCVKNKFKCSDIINSKDSSIGNLLIQQQKLTEDNKNLKYMLMDHAHYLEKYEGLPSMDDMIKDGRAKKLEQEPFRAKWKEQFKLTLTWGSEGSRWGTEVTEWHRMDSGNVYPMWRIPKAVFQEFVKRSPVDKWKYDKDPTMGDTDDERSYMCMRFSLSMMGERYCSPYYDMMLGMVWILGHSLNLIWFSDDERIYYFEPQGDVLRVACESPTEPQCSFPRELWL